jgi:hypothetical protein
MLLETDADERIFVMHIILVVSADLQHADVESRKDRSGIKFASPFKVIRTISLILLHRGLIR